MLTCSKNRTQNDITPVVLLFFIYGTVISILMNNTSTSTYSLDPTDPSSLPYLDNLRLLAAKSKGEVFPPDLKEKKLLDLQNVDVQVRESSECSQVVGVTISPNGGDNTNTSNSIGDNSPSSQTINLGHIISIIPTSNEDYFLDFAASATLAIHHFNTGDPSVLPFLKHVNNGDSSSCSIRFTHEFFDSEQNPMTASRIYLNEIRPRKRHFLTASELNEPIDRQVARPYPTALIGSQTSETTHSLVTLTGIYNLVQISHASTSSKFDDKHLFPKFGRVVPSTDGDAKVALDFIHGYLGSSFAGVLYEKGPFGDSFANALQNAAVNKVKLEIVPMDSDDNHVNFYQSISSAVSQLAQTKFNIFFAIVEPSHYEQLMEEAYKQGIAGPGRLWLFASIPSTFFNVKKYPAGSPLAIVTHGIGLLKLGTPIHTKVENPVINRFLKVWRTINEPEFKEYFKSKQPRFDKSNSFHKVDHYDFSEEPNWLSLFMYDAVISICLSACKLEHINSSPHFTPSELFETFKSINFEGVTGSVSMDEHASRKYTTVTWSMTNVVANEVDDDGMVSFSLHEPLTYNRHSGSTYVDNDVKLPYCRQGESGVPHDPTWQQMANMSEFIYSSSTTTPPLPIPPLEMNIISISTPLLIIGLSLGAIASVTSILLFIWTLKNRRSRVVQLDQPIFLLFICTGCFIMSLTIIPMSLKDPNFDKRTLNLGCIIGPWLYTIGFVLAFSAVIAKTSRLNSVRKIIFFFFVISYINKVD